MVAVLHAVSASLLFASNVLAKPTPSRTLAGLLKRQATGDESQIPSPECLSACEVFSNSIINCSTTECLCTDAIITAGHQCLSCVNVDVDKEAYDAWIVECKKATDTAPEKDPKPKDPSPEKDPKEPVPDKGTKDPVPDKSKEPVPDKGTKDPVPDKDPVHDKGTKEPAPEKGSGGSKGTTPKETKPAEDDKSASNGARSMSVSVGIATTALALCAIFAAA
ncbi:hypothetical protein DXG03_009616 [Asterophora parasitica]|uniref:Extracellular membrane protein CFEM domain-containing protein n=1 Tax=Asterophora parasitica TaxID=117018 RepID=A0A9P7G586_9AGAR|nr:hypothetical protein DXG03_009616 [Asterophora parasitica]